MNSMERYKKITEQLEELKKSIEVKTENFSFNPEIYDDKIKFRLSFGDTHLRLLNSFVLKLEEVQELKEMLNKVEL